MSDVIYHQISEERNRQDAQWGGPAHDDEHDAGEWVAHLAEYLERARKDSTHVAANPDGYRHRLVTVAALAVAAIESHDRTHGVR